MRAHLPKDARGFGFPRLFEVDLNDFEMERILTDVFYLVVSGGRQRGKSPNDPKAISTYRDKLSQSARVEGFGDPVGLQVLDLWVRGAVIRTSTATRRQTGEQIDYLLPQSLAVYKAGFPDNYRQRNIPGFLYDSMVSALRDTSEHPQGRLRDIFIKAFGTGVEISEAPSFTPRYDGRTSLDIHTLLTLTYLDGFEPVLASARRANPNFSAALPAQAISIGVRLARFLDAYAELIPPSALARSFVALANLELFVYSLKLFHATTALVRDRVLPPAMQGEPISDPELYCDFSTVRGGVSEALARACVERDLEMLSAFVAAAIRLRTIDKYSRRTKAMADQLDELGADTPHYLLALCNLADHQRVGDWAELEFEKIRDETIRVLGSEMEAATASQFEAMRSAPATELERVVGILVSEQRRPIQHLTSWYQSAGGLKTAYGVLAGAPRSRTSWRYTISDDLLSTLVLLAHVDPAAVRDPGNRLALREFLEYIERSYGLIVDRSPRFSEDTISRAAARQNLAGMKRKLREMDLFSELSDDFSAQYLTVPVETAQ